MKFDFLDNNGNTVKQRLNEYTQLKTEYNDYGTAAKEISEWLVPGRGIFNTESRATNRVLVPTKIVNPKAKQALGTLVSFLKDGICPSSRPWFLGKLNRRELEQYRSLVGWSFDVTDALRYELRKANFYTQITQYIKELCSFATASMGVFPGDSTTLHFMPSTFGEYVVGTNNLGVVDRYYRTGFMNFWQLLGQFGEELPKELLEKFKNREGSLDYWYTAVEGVVPESYLDMPFTRFFILLGDGTKNYEGGVFYKIPKINKYNEFIGTEGVAEFPYPTTRFDIIGNDIYGVGPGHEAVPVIKRLQEIVRANNIAYHKTIRPPMNAPVTMKNNVKTYPDAINYYINPEEIIRPVQDTRFDHTSAEVSEGKLEATLKEIFFNDVFLTTSRDPNASPLKARQVEEISNDKYARIGDTLERFFFEGIEPILNRSYGICERAGILPEVPPEFADLGAEIDLDLTSLLAQAVKARASIPMQEFLRDIGAISQFDPQVMDIPDTDGFVYELASIRNIHPKLLKDKNAVKAIRDNRQQRMAAKEQEAKNMQQQQMSVEEQASRASATRDLSEAGLNLSENFGEGGLL